MIQNVAKNSGCFISTNEVYCGKAVDKSRSQNEKKTKLWHVKYGRATRSCWKQAWIGRLYDRLGKSMKCKLSRSKVTGLVNPLSFFIPWTVFWHLLVLLRGYSGDVHTRVDGLTHVLTLTKMDSVRKVFFAQRVPSKAGGKTESVCNETPAIVLTESTPFCMNYAMKTQRVTMTFFIQRYTAEHFVVDISLQALMNGWTVSLSVSFSILLRTGWQ